LRLIATNWKIYSVISIQQIMNFGFNIKKLTTFVLIVLITTITTFSQNTNSKTPRQEKLLNGLKVLMWSDPSAQNVSVKIRFHSGSSFDPQDKEGLMQILAENIFPNDVVKEFFTEDLGGSVEVLTNFDYIQINAAAKPEEFLSLMETLANAVANPTIDKEITAKLKVKQLEKVKELEKNPAYIADQATAKRLFGNFPYGRKQAGSPESVQKIDFADLIFAKERFLTADNATVTITGNFKTDLAFRAARRYFGAWIKSDKRVPSTFRQPDEPDTKPFGVTLSSVGDGEVRYAMRGLARNDKDFAASMVLTHILDRRLQDFAPKQSASNIFVRQDERILPGVIVFGYKSSPQPVVAMPTDSANSGEKSANLPQNTASLLLSQSIKTEEYNKAKAEVLADLSKKTIADWWLDVDTFKITSVSDESAIFNSVTQADVQRVAEKLYKNPVVSVSLIQTGEETSKN
jgi:predicted Zn-dependent peptidase